MVTSVTVATTMAAMARAGTSHFMREMLASGATHARPSLVSAGRAHVLLWSRRLRHARRLAAVPRAHAGLRAEPPRRRVHRALGLRRRAAVLAARRPPRRSVGRAPHAARRAGHGWRGTAGGGAGAALRRIPAVPGPRRLGLEHRQPGARQGYRRSLSR